MMSIEQFVRLFEMHKRVLTECRMATVVGCIVSDPIIIVTISLARNFMRRLDATRATNNEMRNYFVCVGMCL